MNIKKKYYNIEWFDKNFYIDNLGNLNILINKKKKIKINNLINNKNKNKLPIKFCFPQIINKRIKLINIKFKIYIKKYKYNGKYFFVYPTKVNQQPYIIKYITKYNKYNIGLESGSKAELMNILINTKNKIKILCNGYKDITYIHLAYIATKIGHKVFIIIEKFKEIKYILKYIKNKNFELGIRIKLNYLEINQNKNKSQFKFGLTSTQLIKIIKILKKKKIEKKIKILHCHIGSQINKINYICKYLKEFIRIYIDIFKLFNIKIKFLDIGGGLAVNYNNIKNKNYNIDIYISNILKLIIDMCKKKNISTPNIITESGRYITAHHEFLITNIINTEINNFKKIKNPYNNKYINKNKKTIIEIWNIWNNIKKKSFSIKIIKKKLNKIKQKFQNGKYNIYEKSWIEKIYINILIYIKKNKKIKNNNNFLYNINSYISNKVHLNFSLFQSIPDNWGIKQIFPILPIEKLNNKIFKNINILDITCDSDGKIDKYINKNYISNTLKILKYNINNPPKIGFFMIGAYQNILSNIHNLFGNVETYIINIIKKNKFKIKLLNKHENILNIIKKIKINKKEINIFFNKYKKNIYIYKNIKKILNNKTYLN